MKIVVLMSTYNGEKYLRDQLESLLNQQLKPNKILIRDDGSRDDTVNILEEYASKYSFINYYCGKNIGPAKSFFELINKAEKADYYALCDQDDVWFEDKLSSAIEMLKKEDDIPLLYFSRFTLTDGDLNPINSKVSSLYKYTDFAHALLYQTAPGCTFVFNDKARELITKYDINNNFVMIHDSIIHKVIAMNGKVILDNNSHIYYRQHGNNEIGLTGGLINHFITRIKNFIIGKTRNTRSNLASSLLNVYGQHCGKEENELMNIVSNYKKDFSLRKKLIFDKRFRVDGINYYLFRILVLINYI